VNFDEFHLSKRLRNCSAGKAKVNARSRLLGKVFHSRPGYATLGDNADGWRIIGILERFA